MARAKARRAGARSKPRALVTGGAGFLGSHLCERLLAEGYRVICMDNLRTGTLENVAHLEDDLQLLQLPRGSLASHRVVAHHPCAQSV